MLLQTLFETIDNLFINDINERRQYAEQVFNIITQSYASQGGIKGSGFSSPEDMIATLPMWKLARSGDKIKAVMMYKDKNGRKRVAIGTDGSPQGKQMLFKMLKDEASTQRAYVELSGKSLAVHKKLLGDLFTQLLVPATMVPDVLPKENIKLTDNQYEYIHMFNGEPITKVMMGKPFQPIR